MITFDFFNDEQTELVQKFCEYFRLDIATVTDYFTTVNPDSLTPEVIVKKFGLKLNEYNSNELQIMCRHMTTAEEGDLQSFKEKGILDLRTMLQEDTILSAFLLKHKIKVFVDEHKIEINDKTYPILGGQEVCDECYEGREHICTGYSRCKSFEKISHLSTKLYFYGATVECFIHATLEEMERYSTIDKCPEILNTLDDVYSAVSGQYSTTYKLCYDWMAKKKNCYVIEYPCQWSKMETFAPINYRDAYYDYENLLYLSGFDYSDYMERNVPKMVYDNIVFLKRFISIYFYDSEEYGSLLPEEVVSPEKIRIMQVVGKKLVKLII